MAEQDLKNIVDKAKKAVEHLEEPYKSKAFEVLLSKLLSGEPAPASTPVLARAPVTMPAASYEPDAVEKAMNKIDRTKYPLMFKLRTVLERAIYALCIAREQGGLDWLTAPEISKLLMEKFRVKATSAAVSMALMRSEYVDRNSVETGGGAGYNYRLMHAGEERIKALLKDPFAEQSTTAATPKSKNNRTAIKRTAGPAARIAGLMEKSFFEKPKDAMETNQRLKDDGFHHEAKRVHTALLRMVRQGKLRRLRETKGETTVYKYVNP